MKYIKEHKEFVNEDIFGASLATFLVSGMSLLSLCVYDMCHPEFNQQIRQALEKGEPVTVKIDYDEKHNYGDFKKNIYDTASDVEKVTKELSVVVDHTLVDNMEIEGDTLKIKYIDVMNNLEEEFDKELDSKLVGQERGEENVKAPIGKHQQVVGTDINNIETSFESFAVDKEDLADLDDREKVLNDIQTDIKKGIIQKFQVDADEVEAAISKLNLKLSDEDLDWVLFMIEEGDGVNESTTFQDVERFLHQSQKENPTDDDAELAERAIMNRDFVDADDQIADWAFDIAMEIMGGNFY